MQSLTEIIHLKNTPPISNPPPPRMSALLLLNQLTCGKTALEMQKFVFHSKLKIEALLTFMYCEGPVCFARKHDLFQIRVRLRVNNLW